MLGPWRQQQESAAATKEYDRVGSSGGRPEGRLAPAKMEITRDRRGGRARNFRNILTRRYYYCSSPCILSYRLHLCTIFIIHVLAGKPRVRVRPERSGDDEDFSFLFFYNDKKKTCKGEKNTHFFFFFFFVYITIYYIKIRCYIFRVYIGTAGIGTAGTIQ